MRKLFFFLALALTLPSGRALAFTPAEDGLYAVFDTSLGEFTVQLYFETTEQTVANFVGLAEGSIDWLNEETGLIQRNHPFYDGIEFHRVIDGFVIQAGSPNGEGTDGPGYNIYDEIVVDDPNFNFSRAGLMAMANTGAANSGGAQFFINVNTPTNLNHKHTIFGEVVEGMDVVNTINEVPTTDEVPDEPVVINRVTIVREGDAAEAFDATAHDVPTLGEPDIHPVVGDEEYFLNFDLQPFYEYTVYQSGDLEEWLNIGFLRRVFMDTGRDDISIGAGLPAGSLGFWQAVRATYPNLPNGGVTIEFTDTTSSPNQLAFTVVLNEDLTGTFTPADGDPFDLQFHVWHEFGGDNVTLFLFGATVRPLQFYLKGGDTGEAILFLEQTAQFPENFIEELTYEITAN